MPHPGCPLCQGRDTDLYHADQQREYWQCRRCALIFVPPAQRLDAAAEKAEYDRHENDPDEPGYRHFLSRLAEPLKMRLAPGSRGLDFGCGPGPALAAMLEEAGHDVALYDPFYANRPDVLQGSYQFITCTEVIEHLYHPAREIPRLVGMLASGGWLGVMTKQVIDRARFAGWHYTRDPTHVCFYSRPTFRWIGQRWGLEPLFVGPDVVLLQKSGRPAD
ncbi:MAG: methyltransferase domain-containing protein [Pseudomonadota bacterium]|nr:methyltransferase domain-containing protein [Pseudomonadota bacterium]